MFIAILRGPATAASPAHAAQPADLFDLWLGDWRVSWQNADGTTGKARNRIAKTLDGKLIEEHFEQDASDPPLIRQRRWRQVPVAGWSLLWRLAYTRR